MDFEPLYEKQIHPNIARVAQYCQDLAGDKTFPNRRDFRPSAVRSIIGYVFLIDILPEDDDYYFSLFGVHMATLYGMDLSKKRLSKIGDENVRGFLRKTYDTVAASRSFQYLRGRYTWPTRSVEIERLLVPMADDEGRLTTILGVTLPASATDTLLVFAGVGAAQLEIDEEIQARRKLVTA